jgi:hypothetical protein
LTGTAAVWIGAARLGASVDVVLTVRDVRRHAAGVASAADLLAAA